MLSDFRAVMAIFFGLLGIILTVTGVSLPEIRAPLAEGNVNLAGGIMMLIFGGILFWFSQPRG